MGGKQLGFSEYEQASTKKQTKREKFLAEIELVAHWDALFTLIEPHYPKISKMGGRHPSPLVKMLLIHLLQQWHALCEPGMEESLITEPTMLRLPASI